MTRYSLLTITGIITVALAGCISTPPDRASSDAVSTTPPETTVPDDEPAAPNDEPGQDVRDADPSAAHALACLHGAWRADNAFFLASIQDFGDEVKSIDGTVFVTFDAGGIMTTDYQDWMITASAEGQEVQLKRSGVDNGVYTATETTVTINDTSVGSTLTMNIAGVDMAITPEPTSYADAEYTCSPNQATVFTEDGTLVLNRL